MVLATLAAIIASQAVITGVFSLTRQAIQLGYLPRMEIQHTSETEIGQIYVPRVNWILMGGIVALVVGFGSSDALAGAYGLAVTGAMLVDAALAMAVAILVWKWTWPVAVAGVRPARRSPTSPSSSPTRSRSPTAAGCRCWWRGWCSSPSRPGGAAASWSAPSWRRRAAAVASSSSRMERAPDRVAGTAVFLTADATSTPPAFLHNLKHNKMLHERIIIMQVDTMDVPRVPEAHRVEVERLGKGFYTRDRPLRLHGAARRAGGLARLPAAWHRL